MTAPQRTSISQLFGSYRGRSYLPEAPQDALGTCRVAELQETCDPVALSGKLLWPHCGCGHLDAARAALTDCS